MGVFSFCPSLVLSRHGCWYRYRCLCGGRLTFQFVFCSISSAEVGNVSSFSWLSIYDRRRGVNLSERNFSSRTIRSLSKISFSWLATSGVKYDGAMYLSRKSRSLSLNPSSSSSSSPADLAGSLPLEDVSCSSTGLYGTNCDCGRSNSSPSP
ncbi:hypothetical protein H106_06670 [Trichophyton rubrum CBS 735.88]|nr:hypothetical protein H106_06670 [Trichophyton rubrum CBS 735.88]